MDSKYRKEQKGPSNIIMREYQMDIILRYLYTILKGSSGNKSFLVLESCYIILAVFSLRRRPAVSHLKIFFQGAHAVNADFIVKK